MLHRKLIIFFLAFIGLHFGSATKLYTQDLSFLSDSVSYAWPTDASKYLSSTFAETRSAHLHSGLDIRTWGREGYEVYATRDAELYRIGIGPSGYGKVLYLKHPDESYSVYAHLQRFHPNLQAYADSIRLKDFSFEMDHFVPQKKFTFKKGELIGYSGSTGVGPPHLHFELRTPDFEPFNPLLTNLSIDDDIPPVINSIAVESLHPETLQFSDYEIAQPIGENGTVLNFGTLRTDSPVGISINVHDRANRTPNYYAVYELMMVADGDTLFHSQANNFDFTEASMMFLDRSYPILAETRRGYQRLYNVNGNQLPIYKQLSNRGLLGLSPGEQNVTITAIDYYGNRRTATFTLISEGNGSREQVTSVPAYPLRDSNGRSSVPNSSPAHARVAPTYKILDNNPVSRGPSPSPRDYAYIFSDTDYSPVTISTIDPGKKNVLHSSGYNSWVTIPSKSLYDTLSISMEYGSSENLPSIRFQPNRLPVNETMQFTMLLPDEIADDPSIGLYSYDEYRNRYTYLNSTVKHGVLKAELNEFAELRIRRDRTAPWVGKAKITADPTGIYVVHVPAVDRDSGIDYQRSTIEVNGTKGIIEYDKDKDLLIFYNPKFSFNNGENRVDVSIYDRTGNQSDRSYNLTLTR
ncbi:M23 family metallopeptidase [Rhodohalobacter sp. 8-1]|uniref:M23 family metallopeptidase n=1 Tax=Rhodohalobacter sp. 8-1 TaxID=3131972 RepID=UPI0030EC039A